MAENNDDDFLLEVRISANGVMSYKSGDMMKTKGGKRQLEALGEFQEIQRAKTEAQNNDDDDVFVVARFTPEGVLYYDSAEILRSKGGREQLKALGELQKEQKGQRVETEGKTEIVKVSYTCSIPTPYI